MKQKLLAAQRAGLTEVFLPLRNEPDLDDVPAEVLEALTVHVVGDVLDVVGAALEHRCAPGGGGCRLEWRRPPPRPQEPPP